MRLARRLINERDKQAIFDVLSAKGAKSRLERLINKDPNDPTFLIEFSQNKNKYAKSSFLASKVPECLLGIEPKSNVAKNKYKSYFESSLHEQLSFSSIPDSRFDPAELAFCLEGLLLCGREAVDAILFTRVLDVLQNAQELSAHWRPSRPFMATPTGLILLPISVEVANSLLRSIKIVDGERLHGTFTATVVPMFRRFWRWLRARAVEISAVDRTSEKLIKLAGWHSEHVNDIAAIHLWQTSQVLEFIQGYRQLLERHIANEALVLSRVSVAWPSKSEDEIGKGWSYITEKYDPETTDETYYRVFYRIGMDYIEPWKARQTKRDHSMLVYGPPGTGKTTVAETIAAELKMPLITVTVSDFLGSGGAMVEARAKAIFMMLNAQSNVVIFFDEMDAFFLECAGRPARSRWCKSITVKE